MELTNTQKTFQRLPSHHIGFVSTRFIGIDGVSLEAEKWSTVLEALGHSCYYFSGQSDRPATRNYIVPEAHFKHADVERVYIAAFSERIRRTEITRLKIGRAHV